MKIILLSFAVLTLTGCTLTVSPDGSRTYAPDPATLRVILEK
jgi:uncharacterized protein YceK